MRQEETQKRRYGVDEKSEGGGFVEELDYAKGAAPLYIQIKQILKARIISREYAPGDRIPTEAQLQEMFQVSRITARQAITELVNEGMVERERGKGTRVLFHRRVEEQLKEIRSFTKDMESHGLHPGTRYAHIERIEADDHLAQVFHCHKGTALFRVDRIRTIDEVAIVHFTNYFLEEYDLPLDDRYYYGSLYSFLQNHNIARPKRVKERFGAALANYREAEKLDIKKGDPILTRESIGYDEEGNVKEYTVSTYPGERYSYTLELG